MGYALEPNETGWIFGGNLVNGALPTAIPNPNLTWYTSKTADLGLDLDLWNGKLGIIFDYFNRSRTGLLATSLDLIPGTVGANLPQENLESDRTFGYELSLTHRNKINDFQYFVNAQVSSTKISLWTVSNPRPEIHTITGAIVIPTVIKTSGGGKNMQANLGPMNRSIVTRLWSAVVHSLVITIIRTGMVMG
ncbi:TonB-dependent receptor domain-containing protein [Sphingobacterium sp. E70]|uniref:TonB-dependent receptor domain-containing protein n=1 Tax=Sphingobacterium sp. E70 TaxID=2853439 RepID=UPI00211C7349|nr:TonB-dependent receptor [Sphingobacterium sp. E70]